MRADDDLIVALDVSGAPTWDGKWDNTPSPRPSYWQNVLPQQMPDVGFGEHLIVVHTAEHPGRVPRSSGALQAGANGNAFCDWHHPVSLIRLQLSPEYLRRVDATFGAMQSQPEVPHIFHARDPRVVQMGAWLLEELHDRRAAAQLYSNSLATVLALHLLRQYGPTPIVPGYAEASWPQYRVERAEVASAIEYMHAHLGGSISLADLAQAAHISPSHLARLFKRSTGLTPHQFLIRLRVAHARELLLSKPLAISEVAAQSGFSDQSHLNRQLKRIYGVTPNAILSSME